MCRAEAEVEELSVAVSPWAQSVAGACAALTATKIGQPGGTEWPSVDGNAILSSARASAAEDRKCTADTPRTSGCVQSRCGHRWAAEMSTPVVALLVVVLGGALLLTHGSQARRRS